MRGLLASLLLVLAVCTGCRTGSVNLAPVYETEQQPGLRLERAAGPFWEHSELGDNQRLTALRPFWSRYTNQSTGEADYDVLWPLFWHRLTPDYDDHYGLLTLYRSRENRETTAMQSWFFPIYFHHRSAEGNDHFAVFPLGGTLVDFFGYDEISFVLWPIYVSTKKGKQESHAYLWPIFSKTNGVARNKERVFPFYGKAEAMDGWENHFILWPFIHYAKSTDPERPGSGWAVLPFYGRIDREDPARGKYLHNQTWLWPFFSHLETDSANRLMAPWPFFQKAHNFPQQGDDRLYIWPLWGKRKTPTGHNWFALWPFIFNSEATTSTKMQIDRFYVLPVYWHVTKTPEEGAKEDYRRFWPLLSIDKLGEDQTRVKFLDLWPIRQHTVIERNYAPLWTLYEYQRKGERRQHDLLWGFYQYRHGPEHLEKLSLFPFFSYRQDAAGKASDFRILAGLFGREREGDSTSTRWLWFFRTGGDDGK